MISQRVWLLHNKYETYIQELKWQKDVWTATEHNTWKLTENWWKHLPAVLKEWLKKKKIEKVLSQLTLTLILCSSSQIKWMNFTEKVRCNQQRLHSRNFSKVMTASDLLNSISQIQDVVYVPQCDTNLLSLRQLSQSEITYHDNGIEMIS